ncbi:hypothetical protein SAMN02745217_02617 [Anaerocolumna xylanovorans DSM 12503]|uniref:Uncharacterized protein n=1 Tax=Anaerocolumna xylanovorans DSM 12503 TaxID=1121345 RepID=A0A1M7YCD0_9FIRM|nr:hypothetical protein SAMN02745217_02617 [Anaerocolumna xylanovorans DSM 12503]
MEGNKCQFAIPGKEYSTWYEYSYKCAACFECRYGTPPDDKTAKERCHRYAIGIHKKNHMSQ